MKSSLLVTTALGAVFIAAPAFAQEAVTGYADVDYGNINLDSDFGDNDANAWSIGGAVEIPQQSWGLQFDVRYTDADDLTDQGVIQGTAHVHARNDQGLIGGFAGFTDSDVTDQTWVIGAEGQYYFEQSTLSGSVGYGQIDDADVDIWGATGGLAYFIQDDFRVDGEIGWNQAEDGFGDLEVWSFGLGGEYQFPTVPISVFASYEHQEFDEDIPGDLSSDAFRVGIRWNYGGGTLKDRDRFGAALKPLGGIIGAGFPFF
ncbi:outer membrane beta-barrel protein [Caulobacter sp. 17J65-9]|uniref:outer membrane beta-barrel protein n=1 Tax=Caulobacter sp. 17J65-9 TaxID=2709382 RepID=UPI0013CB5606|nr:outer membrane beta-barrel protein [Caulobacter sp. 17J65-9]NEX93123.1 porin family protein [Caulobacter sp. 17J65-9]